MWYLKKGSELNWQRLTCHPIRQLTPRWRNYGIPSCIAIKAINLSILGVLSSQKVSSSISTLPLVYVLSLSVGHWLPGKVSVVEIPLKFVRLFLWMYFQRLPWSFFMLNIAAKEPLQWIFLWSVRIKVI